MRRIFLGCVLQFFALFSFAGNAQLSAQVNYNGHVLHRGLPEAVHTEAITPDKVRIKMTYAKNPYSSSDDPAFLFIHGMGANKNNWLENNPDHLSIVDLAWKSGFETATMHYRGHGSGDELSRADKKPPFNFFKPLDVYYPGKGATDTASSTFYGPDRMVLDIIAAVEKIYNENGGRRVVIVGHSMGEMIPKLVLSGVRYDVVKGKSYELSPQEAKAWVEKYIHRVEISSPLVRVTLKNGRVLTDQQSFTTLTKSNISELEYENGEVIQPVRGQSEYDLGSYTLVKPFNDSGKLNLTLSYYSYPGLIGNGGPADFNTEEMSYRLGFSVSAAQKQALAEFFEKSERVLNWIASPNHNKSWFQAYKDLPVNRLRANIRGRVMSPLTAYFAKKTEEQQVKMLISMIEKDPKTKSAVREMIKGMIGPAENFDLTTDELQSLMHEAGSGMSLSVVVSVLHWVANGYSSRDRNVNYAFRKLYVNSFMVRADQDVAAPALSMMKELETLGNTTRYMIMQNTGHMGILVRQRRQQLYEAMMEFVHNPLTKKYKSGREAREDVTCAQLLARLLASAK